MEDVAPAEAPVLARQNRFLPWEAVRTPSLRNMLCALVAGLLFAAAGAWLILRQSPLYFSQATVVIDNPVAIATANDDGPIVKLNALRLKYASLAATPAILRPAAQAAGLPLADVSRTVTLPSLAALVLTVSARSGSPSVCQRSAEAVADQIVLYVQHEHERYNIPPVDRFGFSVVGRAFRGRKIAPSRSKAETTAVGAGVAAIAVVYLILQVATGPRRLL